MQAYDNQESLGYKIEILKLVTKEILEELNRNSK